VTGSKLDNTRLSLVAAQCFFGHRTGARQTADQVLWERAQYEAAYGRIQAGATLSRYAHAWRPGQQSRFWSYYLGGRSLGEVSARTAWQALVPLRLTTAPAPLLATDDPREKLFFDIYGYPNSLTLALTIQSPARVSSDTGAWRDRQRTLRRGAVFTLTDPDKAASGSIAMTAEDAIEAVLAWYRLRYYGQVGEIYRSGDIFSLIAVIKGSGVDPSVPIDDDTHRLLYAVTGWPRDWKNVSLPDLTTPGVLLPVRQANAYAADALYANTQGRTLWRPGLFNYVRAPGESPPHTLSCLAHNLVSGTVQAETLRVFALGYAGSDAARRVLDDDEPMRCARTIDALVKGEGTYRSSSVRALLEQPGSKAQVNALLTSQHRDAVP
jgi:hypothetical protein